MVNVSKMTLTKFANKYIFSYIHFASLYGAFLFLYEIQFLRQTITVFHPLFLFWGGIVFIKNTIIDKNYKLIPGCKILIMFIFIVLLTSLLNLNLGVISVTKSSILACVPILVLYPAFVNSKNRTLDLIKVMSGVSLILFIFSLFAIICFILQFSLETNFNGIKSIIGIRSYINSDGSTAMLVYGLYEDTNHSAAYAIVSIIISIITLLSINNVCVFKHIRLLKIYSVSNIVIQTLYFPLANSRGSYVSLFVAGYIGLLLYLLSIRKIKNIIIRISVALIVPVFLMSVIYYSTNVLRTGLTELSYCISSIEKNKSNVEHTTEPTDEVIDEQSDKPISFNKKGESLNKLSSGRFEIWTEVLEIYKIKPILGITPIGNELYAKKINPESLISHGKAIHNSYLDLLLNYGIVGSLIYFVFLMYMLKNIIKKMYAKKAKTNLIYSLVVIILGIVLIAGFLLSCLFINSTAMQFVLMISLSYIAFENKAVISEDKT